MPLPVPVPEGAARAQGIPAQSLCEPHEALPRSHQSQANPQTHVPAPNTVHVQAVRRQPVVVGWHLPIGFEDNLFDMLAGGVWPAAACPKHVGNQPQEAAAFLNHVSQGRWPPRREDAGFGGGGGSCTQGAAVSPCAPAAVGGASPSLLPPSLHLRRAPLHRSCPHARLCWWSDTTWMQARPTGERARGRFGMLA